MATARSPRARFARLTRWLDVLRQQVRDDVRMHAIVTDGGAAANIIPETAAMNAVARAKAGAYLFDELVPRLENVFRGAALMTGTELEIAANAPLEAAFTRHATRRGRSVTPYDLADGTGSTDMGNVSQAVPGLHGMLDIDDVALPHTEAERPRVHRSSRCHASAARPPSGHPDPAPQRAGRRRARRHSGNGEASGAGVRHHGGVVGEPADGVGPGAARSGSEGRADRFPTRRPALGIDGGSDGRAGTKVDRDQLTV